MCVCVCVCVYVEENRGCEVTVSTSGLINNAGPFKRQFVTD